MARIYISSTYSDLIGARDAVYGVLRKMGHNAIAMEDYVATDQRPLDKCLADVRSCDVYVGIFAWRYGYVPPNQEQSITELEFREAVRREKPCLLFLLHEDAPWPRSQVDRDATRIEALRAELSRDYTVSFFRTPDDLAASVSIATGAALEESAQARAVDRVTPEAASRRLEELPLDVVPARTPLPRGSVMPLSPNPIFVGREDGLKALAKNLKAGDTTAIGQMAIAAATGLGGIGKTQLASEFVHRYGQYFAGGVFWLSFADPSAIPAEVAACGGAGAMELGPDFRTLHLEDQVREVMSAWQSEFPRLLVFDNCEEEELLVRWRPPTGGGRVLVTSRRERWGPTLGVRTLPLNVLPREESIALLREHRPEVDNDDPDLDAIAEELGDLPLALELAGSYLASYRYVVTPASYLRELRSRELLQHRSLQKARELSPTSHPQGVARTFALSYERLNTEDPVEAVAVALLARAACFAAGEPIPRGLLHSRLDLDDEEPDGTLRKEDALSKLIELGMLETEEAGAVRMHRLVAEFVSNVIDDEEAQTAVEVALIDAVGPLIAQGIPAPISAFLPHLRAITDAIKEREDEQAGRLHYQLGRYLHMVGSYAEALPYFGYELMVNEYMHGEEHSQTAVSLTNVANVLRHQGEYDETRRYLERAQAIIEKTYGEEHPDTAGALHNLGILLHNQGEYDEARRYYERALASYAETLGEEHPRYHMVLQNPRILDARQ